MTLWRWHSVVKGTFKISSVYTLWIWKRVVVVSVRAGRQKEIIYLCLLFPPSFDWFLAESESLEDTLRFCPKSTASALQVRKTASWNRQRYDTTLFVLPVRSLHSVCVHACMHACVSVCTCVGMHKVFPRGKKDCPVSEALSKPMRFALRWSQDSSLLLVSPLLLLSILHLRTLFLSSANACVFTCVNDVGKILLFC